MKVKNLRRLRVPPTPRGFKPVARFSLEPQTGSSCWPANWSGRLTAGTWYTGRRPRRQRTATRRTSSFAKAPRRGCRPRSPWRLSPRWPRVAV